jgi:hypothetical protein
VERSSYRQALDARHRESQQTLSGEVSLRLSGVLLGLPDLGEESLARYAASAFPLVLGGQRASAGLAASYVLAMFPAARRSGRQVVVDPGGALARSGKAVTQDSPVVVSPILRARSLLAEGARPIEAMQSASSYAEALSSGDLQAAQRVGIEEGAQATGARVVGYRKELSATACSWCRKVGGRTYRSSESVPFHQRDNCAVAPVLAGEE